MPDIAQQFLLYAHIIAFALAMAEVLREDWHMLWATKLDTKRLEATARRVTWFLIALWATGVPLIGLSLGWDFSLIADKPKLIMKLLVVAALTVNGVLLHFVAFPMLKKGAPHHGQAAAISSALGAISTVSWLYASFVGAARYIAPKMTLLLFAEIYLVMLACGLAVALLFVRHRVARVIAVRDQTPWALAAAPRAMENNAAAFVEIDVALAAVGHAHKRLATLRNNLLLQYPQAYRSALQELTARGLPTNGPRREAASSARAA